MPSRGLAEVALGRRNLQPLLASAAQPATASPLSENLRRYEKYGLEHGGYLTIKATMSQPIACFTPETALYLVFDRAATGRDTSADAVEIAGLWLQDNTMHIIPHLRDRLGWEPRRLNPALCALRYVFPENGWSQLLDPSLVTLRVLIGPSERFQLRRIMESGRIDDTQIAAH